MDLDAQKKREQELEKRLRTPKAVLSRDKATEADTVETNYLTQTFLAGKFYLYETQLDTSTSNTDIDKTELEEIYKREQALTELKNIIKNWIVSVAKQSGMEESLAEDEEARLFTFGSHRLGVNSRGGDIDTVLICPVYVDRGQHFFEELYNLLQNEPHVTELVKVNDPKVLVPVITMNFHGIPVDLAFAKLDMPKIEKKLRNLNDNNLLAACADERMAFSMNGVRNVDMIIQSVDSKEDPTRISNFRTTLRLLKLWAKNRGIYSNAMGYVTGISLAILVAKICQLFPYLKPNKLIQKFFQYYSVWNWDEFPVKIDEIRTYENMERFNEMQWYEPKSEIGEEKITQRRKDEFTSPMMVITPAFPVMNATKKVTRTHLNVMKEQLAVGRDIVMKKPVDWKKLFEKVDFFNDYNNFIEVNVVADQESEFYRWKGLIESQIIVLTKGLENRLDYEDHPRKVQLHPYPVEFSKQDKDFKCCSCYYFGLKFQKSSTESTKEGQECLDLFDTVLEFISKMASRKKDGNYQTANLKVFHVTRDQLPPSAWGIEEPIQPEESTTLGKRNLDGHVDQESEFEPVVTKKNHIKEDIESKSTHFSNSITSSPKELYNNSVNNLDHKGPHDNSMALEGSNHRHEHTANVPLAAVPKEALPIKVHAPPPSQPSTVFKADPRQENKQEPPKKIFAAAPLVGKTVFKTIDLSKGSEELDDFL